MSGNVNRRQNSIISQVILNNEKDTKITIDEELDENRFRTYNIKDVKMAKTYLPENVIRDFKKGFEASTKSPNSTPKSRNFVKKLVATLESKKYRASGHCTADDEFFAKCYSRPLSKNHVSYENQEKKKNYFEEKYNSKMEKASKKSIDDKNKKKFEFEIFKQGEALTNLTIDEYIKLNSVKNIHVTKKNENYFEKRKTLFWSSKNEEKIDEENHFDNSENLVKYRRSFPETNNNDDDDDDEFSINSDKSENLSTIFRETKNKKNIFRRSGQFEEKKTFKNVLSSLIGFKNRNNPALPRGKRNALSQKESLGEEMRLFRRDMMPALLKAAKSYKTEFDDTPISDDTFTTIMAATKPQSDNRSASIHPFYGSKRASTFLQPLPEEIYDFQTESSIIKDKKNSQQRGLERSPPLYQKPSEIIYDVPKSNKHINFESQIKKNDEIINAYQNMDFLNDSNNWRKIHNPEPRKNIICGRRALFIRKRKQEKK
ncbi:NKAP family protein-like [Leptopilina heterotoma]|uniref:NKAP family protein-like n=1 Tax=Leptopilina heterotoma TaxID=63436 RepID=UPI001CA95DA3|nr:NKAP family protein-like [Leptopilina heterotoma]